MIVDKRNFKEAQQQFEKIIKSGDCKYVSIDLEMTGIKGSEQEFKDDLPFEKYNKMKKVAQKYNIIQVGVSLFCQDTQNPDNKKTTAHPFNFYVFPKENNVFTPSINLQIGAIEFNCKHNMDFNRWIYHGIPYFQHEFEHKLKDQFLKEEEDKADQDDLNYIFQKMNPDNQEKVKQIQKQLKNWEEIEQEEGKNSEENQKIEFTEIQWYIRKYLLLYIKDKFPNYIIEVGRDTLSVQKASQKQKEEYEQKVKQQKLDLFEENVGFLRIMQLMWDSKLPVIGHNCLFDHMFMFQAFYGPLPQIYEDFKKKLHEIFPHIFDTKFMTSEIKFENKFTKSTTLENIRDYMEGNLEEYEKSAIMKLATGAENYDWTKPENSEFLHEAGYDSYLTGWVYNNLILRSENLAKVENQFPLYQSSYIMKIGGPDVRRFDSLIFVAKDLNQQQQNGNQNKKEQQQLTFRKIKEKFDWEFFGQHVSIRSHGQYQNSCYFIELYEDGLQEKKEKFIKTVIGLKAEKMSIQSYADYIISKKQQEDAENTKKYKK